MAIQVSYLDQGLHPDWGNFSKAFPHKSAAQTVSSFAGKWDFPAIHRNDDGSWQRDAKPVEAGKGFFGNWPRITPVRKGQPYQDAMMEARSKLEVEKIESFKGNFQYPVSIKPEAVKSIGRGPLTLPARAGAESSDGWAELSQIYFTISIAGQDLGRWQKIEGLSYKMELADYRTGDGDNYRWYEPSFTTFTNIKLTRASSVKGSQELLKWATFAQFHWKRGVTATIEARPLWKNNSVIWKLGIGDVIPVGWTGPGFNSEGKVATETLEITHSGFIDPHGGEPGNPTPGPVPTGMPKEPARKAFTAPPLPGPRTLAGIAEAGGSGQGAYGLE